MTELTDPARGESAQGHPRQPRHQAVAGLARRRRIVAAAIAGALLAVAYVASLLAYASSMDTPFRSPDPPSGGVAVVLVPTAVNGESATVSADVLLYAAADLLVADALREDLVVTLTPSLAQGSIVFAAGQVPSPQRLELPAPGVIERYPFDSYVLRTRVGVAVGSSEADPTELREVPVSYEVFSNAAGWSYAAEAAAATDGMQQRSIGHISRTGPSVLIAVIFILLMLAFGVMSAMILVSVLRGRFRAEMSTASWLTAALFALISLRNSLPGSPPLGSWMDIAVYFWVIVVVMLVVVATISILLSRAAIKRPGA